MEAPPVPKPSYTNLYQYSHGQTAYFLSDPLASANSQHGDVLIIFVNGLGLPQAFWLPTVKLIQTQLEAASKDSVARVYLATYDRYGQGLSKNTDGTVPQPHNIANSVTELELFRQFIMWQISQKSQPKLFLVAHSIGVPLTRLFCQQHPGEVSALLFVDSNMANTDFVSLMPDPDDPSFTPALLPSDTTIEQLRWTRDNYEKLFHPSAPNAENLDRSTLPTWLPVADSPKLVAPNNEKMLLTVIGHDPETFAEESLKISTRGLTEKYMQPAWERYNESLLKLILPWAGEARGVIIAPGSGHFVQRDNPQIIAQEIIGILQKMSR